MDEQRKRKHFDTPVPQPKSNCRAQAPPQWVGLTGEVPKGHYIQSKTIKQTTRHCACLGNFRRVHVCMRVCVWGGVSKEQPLEVSMSEWPLSSRGLFQANALPPS